MNRRTKFAFFATNVRHLENPKRVFQLSPQDIALLNPNTLTCPIFRTRADAKLAKKIYHHVPVLENEQTGKNSWHISFTRMFDMSNDSGLFQFEYRDSLLPLYEAKMFWYFNHRYGDYNDYPAGSQNTSLPDIPDERLADPYYTITPRYWVSKNEVDKKMADKWDKLWLLSFRKIARSTDERSAIFSIIPRYGCGDSVILAMPSVNNAKLVACLYGNFNSLVFDFVTRQKLGGTNLALFIVKQLPVIPPDRYSQTDIEFISSRVLELTYTAYDLKPFAQDMGYDGEPFIWNPDRRALFRAELDAYYAKLYGLTRDELRYILDPADVYGSDFPSETFRVLKNNEIKQFGEYRTQQLVLEAWENLGF